MCELSRNGGHRLAEADPKQMNCKMMSVVLLRRRRRNKSVSQELSVCSAAGKGNAAFISGAFIKAVLKAGGWLYLDALRLPGSVSLF